MQTKEFLLLSLSSLLAESLQENNLSVRSTRQVLDIDLMSVVSTVYTLHQQD